MQVYLSEYLVQSLSDALFHNGELERIDLPIIPMDNATHWFTWLRLGSKLKNADHGAFVQDEPCQFAPYFAEAPPIFNLTNDGFILDAEVYIEV